MFSHNGGPRKKVEKRSRPLDSDPATRRTTPDNAPRLTQLKEAIRLPRPGSRKDVRPPSEPFPCIGLPACQSDVQESRSNPIRMLQAG